MARVAGNGSRSRIPVYQGGRGDYDSATCVSALTADDDEQHPQPFSQHQHQHQHSSSEPPLAVKKKKRKKKKSQPPVWKMQPIDMRAYVPVPEERGGVENR